LGKAVVLAPKKEWLCSGKKEFSKINYLIYPLHDAMNVKTVCAYSPNNRAVISG